MNAEIVLREVFSPMTQRPLVCLLIIEASRSHLDSDKPDAENTAW
jgi:hypothetical protein